MKLNVMGKIPQGMTSQNNVVQNPHMNVMEKRDPNILEKTSMNIVPKTSMNILPSNNIVPKTSMNILPSNNIVPKTSMNILPSNDIVPKTSMNILPSNNIAQKTSMKVIDQNENTSPYIVEKNIEYFLNIGNCFNIGIEINKDMLIFEINENKIYTEKDLENEYKLNTVHNIVDFTIDDIPKLYKYKNTNHIKYRYIIGIEYNKNKLMFIPNFIKGDVIQSFACVSFEKFDIIKEGRFSPNSMGYPQS